MASRRFLPDVRAQFKSLNRRGSRIGVLDGFPKEFRDKRYSVFHKKGGSNNHFQGVQRLGRHLLVTGSFPYKRPRSDLLVARLNSRSADPGPWGSNLNRDRIPPSEDCVVAYFRIDGDYWHPGGFGLLDSLAAIPLEGSGGESRITFVDFSDPENPVRLADRDIDRPTSKAGACAITPRADGRVLLAAWTDSDVPEAGQASAPFHLDLYLSEAPGDTSQFAFVAQFFPSDNHSFHRKFQALDFLWQLSGGEEKLFLIGFENTSESQPNPLDPGENKAYLFLVDVAAVPDRAPPGGPALLPDSFLACEDRKLFETSGNWCNMDAGASAYVDSDQHLIVYSVYHFLDKIGGDAPSQDPVLKCLEFPATDVGPIDRVEDAWIDLYEEAGLEGRRLGILGPWTSSVEDSARLFADDRPFTVTRSIRYQLPEGAAFVLYPESGHRGQPALVLTGTGGRKELNVLATAFSGRFGSYRLEQRSVAVALPNAIVN
jgi:hypothetical protein